MNRSLVSPIQKSLLALAALLCAAPPVAAAPTLRADVEVDPTAYVFGGYSLHAGFVKERWRVDLGAFAMDVPGFYQSNAAFKQSFDGYDVKVQRFLLEDQAGPFLGVDAGVNRMRLRRTGTELSAMRTQLGAGVNGGYRFALTDRLYATAWLGVSYDFNARDVTLGGETFSVSRWTFFPAVHLGWRFE